MLAARGGLVPDVPLMHPGILHPAGAGRVWGYNAGFMALMPAALGVAGEHVAAGDVRGATGADGQIAGVVALAPGDEGVRWI
jgi:hypothetical protein